MGKLKDSLVEYDDVEIVVAYTEDLFPTRRDQPRSSLSQTYPIVDVSELGVSVLGPLLSSHMQPLRARIRLPSEEKPASEAVKVPRSKPLIVRAPGTFFVGIASLLAKRGQLRRIVEQSIADMREEHCEALAAGDHKMARWIAVRGNLSTLWAVFTYLGFWAIVGRAMKMWKGE